MCPRICTIFNKEVQKIKKLEEIENKSHKIIVIGKEEGVFIFYLMFHKNKWYLVAIDRFEVCDA